MKAVALDLDGTLLNSQHGISVFSKQVIQKLIDAGIIVILASARPLLSVLKIASEIGIHRYPVIAANGAIIAQNKNEILYQNSLSQSQYEDLFSFVKEYLSQYPCAHDFTMHVYSGLKWFVPFLTKQVAQEINIIGFEPDVVGSTCFEVHSVEKVMFSSESQYLTAFCARMKARCRFLNAMFSKPNFLEVNAWGVSKYAAIVQLEKIIKCESKNFIAMGDGDNDVEMIQNCGYGVAMANGSSLAKNAAKKIALSHDQDGAAWFLSEYFFKQNDI